MYVEPALERSGVDTSKFMRALYTRTGFDKLMPIVALTTTIAGVLLYGMLSYHTALSTGAGIVLTVGAVFGLLAFGHGAGALGRMSNQYIALVKEAGENPNDAQQKSLTEMEDKLRRHGRISMWLGVIALVLMASARYVSPILG